MKKRASGLLPATVLAVAGGALIATGLVFYFTWLVLKIPPDGTIPAPGKDGSSPFLDVLKVALAVAAGVGGAVALVVSYRRQRLAERDDAGRRSRYASAAQQLGDPQAAVRLAGVYAMAHLADEWDDQRQQCVDVLCAYLRLPWAPADTNTLEPTTTTTEHTWPDGTGQRKTTKTYAGRPGEHEVRATILRVLNTHLQPPHTTSAAAVSWSNLDIDLTAATLPAANFGGAIFNGTLTLSRARFTGLAWFRETQFNGAATFRDAQFIGRAEFTETHFTHRASFDRAHFTGSAWFDRAHFTHDASFDWAHFTHGAAFNEAQFNSHARFNKTQFNSHARFNKTQFNSHAAFNDAQFNGHAEFNKTQFTRYASFNKAGSVRAGVELVGAVLPSRSVFSHCAVPPPIAAQAEAPLRGRGFRLTSSAWRRDQARTQLEVLPSF